MTKSNIEKIQELVSTAKSYPNAVIEYNFDELPENISIKEDSFYGVKAVLNKKVSKNNGIITYKLS